MPLLMCGLTWLVLISTILSSSFVLLEQLAFGAIAHMEHAHEEQQEALATRLHLDSFFPL